MKKKEDEDGRFYLEKLMKLALSLVVLGMFPLFALRDIRRVELGHATELTLLPYEGDAITTSSSLKFLGKGGEFYFLYNSETGETSCLQAKDFREVRVEK